MLEATPLEGQDASKRNVDWLSEKEFYVLESVCEALFPSQQPPEEVSEEVIAYYQRSASDLHLAELIAELLGQEDADTQARFRQFLSLLSNPLVSLLLSGMARPFPDLSLMRRERYLLHLANSLVAALRQGFQAVKRLAGFLYFAMPSADGSNPNWKALNYIPLSSDSPNTEPLALKMEKITADCTLECDVVVVGSGAGGGVVAGELAQIGKSVIVLEKGEYFRDSELNMPEAQGTSELYLRRGLMTSRDLGVVLLAGSTVGGGTVVNWTTSLRAPSDVLEEWSLSSGLDFFTRDTLQESFSAVEQRLSVNSTSSLHNRQNTLLLEGAKALGIQAGTLRRNAVGCKGRCGSCGCGCRYGAKQSTTKTYLHDAYEHGARIVSRCDVRRVIVENGRAVGVEALARDSASGKQYRVMVRARAVAIAAGALNTPAILLRSGIENQHIGRHLHLHPTSTLSGYYREKVEPWNGVMQSAYSDQYSHLTGNYGYILEVPPAHPGLLGLSVPWRGAREYRELMSLAAYFATFIVITRDKGEGTVTMNRQGEADIRYIMSAFDRRHLLHGLKQAARMHRSLGAEGMTSLQNRPTLARSADGKPLTDEQLSEFERRLERHGLGPNQVMLFSAHQMGSCRAGADPHKAVVDERQQVFGVKNLYVCDSSVFPGALGVNPMLTIMALAHRAAQEIKREY